MKAFSPDAARLLCAWHFPQFCHKKQFLATVGVTNSAVHDLRLPFFFLCSFHRSESSLLGGKNLGLGPKSKYPQQLGRFLLIFRAYVFSPPGQVFSLAPFSHIFASPRQG